MVGGRSCLPRAPIRALTCRMARSSTPDDMDAWFTHVEHRHTLSRAVRQPLHRSGGSIILSIPKTIVESLAVDAGSVVDLSLHGRSLSATPTRRTLAERLAASPKSPAQWRRDDEWLEDAPEGREAL